MKEYMKILRLLLFFCIISSPLTLHLSCLVSDSNLPNDLEHLMDRYHEVGLFQGAVLVSHNNQVVLEKAYGEANREWHVKNTIDTKFRLGSATKPFTAAIVMKFVEEGLLDLCAKVSDYLPYYPADIGNQISIHHLLTHSSGIQMPAMSMDEYWEFFQLEWSTKELVDSLCSRELKFIPGSHFSYSSAGYILLGAIIEKISGKSYERVLSEYIFEPNNMNNTGVDNPITIVSKRASGYQTNFGYGNARYKYMPSSHASGSLYSTVRDLYKWDQLLKSNNFLSDSTKKMMYTSKIESHRGGFGYGWFIDTVRVSNSIQTRVFHAGDVSGFCALYVRVLESGDFIALLSNEEGLNYYDIAFSILDLLNGIELEKPRPYLSDLMRYIYYNEGLEAMKSKYASFNTNDLDNFKIDEDEINEVGYDILTVGDVIAAIEVFKINVELHPGSSHAYDSLGEGFMTLGNMDLALLNYEISLKLNPENSNAVKMIKLIKKKK